jgi:hypothetical protein
VLFVTSWFFLNERRKKADRRGATAFGPLLVN